MTKALITPNICLLVINPLVSQTMKQRPNWGGMRVNKKYAKSLVSRRVEPEPINDESKTSVKFGVRVGHEASMPLLKWTFVKRGINYIFTHVNTMESRLNPFQ